MATEAQGGRDYTSMGAFRTDALPWRLWEKAKRDAWNPSTIDFSRDGADFEPLDEKTKRWIVFLAGGFMVGEEAVALDIVPLLNAVSREGRLEEAMFLTTFASDEAKHVEFFRRWFDAIGVGEPAPEFRTESYQRLFDEELPRVLRRLDTDPAPEAFLDVAITYNQFIEGVLAMTGYWAWGRVCEESGLFPGMAAGLRHVRLDERRHMAYGTYLCRRIVAAQPELWDFVVQRLMELQPLAQAIIEETNTYFEPPYPFGFSPEKTTEYTLTQFPRRMEVIEVARRQASEAVEEGAIEERLEDELERTAT